MLSNFIQLLNSSDSRLHKENVLEKILIAAKIGSSNEDIFLNLLHKCYDNYVTFGLKQIVNREPNINGCENPWNDFLLMLDQLSHRVYTGNSARDLVENMSYRFDSDEWNLVCAPVLRKDIRCGISEKTINKVVKNTKYVIPTFGCQLATSCEDRPEMIGTKRLEPKLDGVRLLLMVWPTDSGDVHAVSLSRNGKVFENFKHIEEQVIENFYNLSEFNRSLMNGFVLDGEVMGKNFQELMKVARRKENADASDSVFHVFDIIPLDQFRSGAWMVDQQHRTYLLEKKTHIFDFMPNVTLIEHIVVDLDTIRGRETFKSYCNRKVNEGYEGVMIKDMFASYQCKRTTSWLKWKPVITVDLEVINVEEGTGRNIGRLGALVCEGIDDGRKIHVNVGSGFSDIDRDSFWVDRGVVCGRIAEVMADAVTQNQDGTYSLRFPRFVRFRDALTGTKE
jgi:DNA ligase-1